MMGLVHYASFVVAIALCVAVTAVRFAHPDMTETRLFLDYWPLCVGAGIAVTLWIWTHR